MAENYPLTNMWNGWLTNNSATTTDLIYSTSNITYPKAVWSSGHDPLIEGAARRQDPLEWMRGRIDEIVQLGTLND